MAGGNVTSIAAKQPVKAPDFREREGEGGEYDEAALPPGAPVTPLGIEGRNLWMLCAAQQMICCDTRLGKNDMVLLFGGVKWLTDKFPQYRVVKGSEKDKPEFEVVGFDQKTSSEALVIACQRKGIFNPAGRVFGRGAHRDRDDDGQLVLHLGKSVLIAGAPDKKGNVGPVVSHPPGMVGRSFYPAYDQLPPPADEPSGYDDARELLDIFGNWYWVEPTAGPLVLIGFVAQMFLCGALEWRSHVWLAGPTASGKTTLQKLIRAIHTDWCLHTADASEAGIRQVLRDDVLPVMIDEAEADDNPEKQRAILNLAKKASAGDKIFRGSQDHKGQEFKAQSCFLFSSVIHSLIKGEELNRVAVLDMRPIPVAEGGGDPVEWDAPDYDRWRTIGRRMHRRMIEQWPRFERTWSDYKRQIASHGFEGRWQDTFGTLLACADLLFYDIAPSAEPEEVPDPLPGLSKGPRGMVRNPRLGRHGKWVLEILPLMRRGKSEARTDVDRCLAHLMSFLIPGEHGKGPEAIGQWITRAMSPVQSENPLEDGGVNAAARAKLKQYGLRPILIEEEARKVRNAGEPLPTDDGWCEGYLAVAYSTNKPLSDVFRGTEWAGGKWIQSLGKIDGARTGLKIWFTGSDNAIAVPLMALKEGGG